MTTSIWDPKCPTLSETLVCHADILGFRALTELAFEQGEATEFLRKIKVSIHSAYEGVRRAMTPGGVAPSIFDMKVYTDNIVVAYPIQDLEIELGERELGTILMLFSRVQLMLALDGFLLRGAISYGDHYQDNDIAYGRALLEAVDLDKTGGAPRLVIAPSAEPLIALQLTSYGPVESAPHYEELLEDPNDDRFFVNYLGLAFENFRDFGIDRTLIEAHRELVCSGLRDHASNARVRRKYEWLASYHNYVCRAFAEWNLYSGPDPEEMDFSDEAQTVLQYLVPFEVNGLLPPRPFDAERLQQHISAKQKSTTAVDPVAPAAG